MTIEDFTNIIDVVEGDIELKIKISSTPLTYEEAWGRGKCGDGTWVYCKERHALERVAIGSHSDLPYSRESFSPKNSYYKVLASSHPLWVWWGQGCTKLTWEDKSNIALPQLVL